MITSADEPLDRLLRALADPTRRRLFAALLETPGLSTAQLVTLTRGMSRWGVMKHLAQLRDAGLIQTMPAGRERRHYPEPAALAPLSEWLASTASA
jgi:DNA-binding transcriptional ArsR family regulator